MITAETKQTILNRVRLHRQADQLVKGMTGEDGKGCSIWCSFEYYDHKRGAEESGCPEWLLRLNDTLFEGMSDERSQQWPEQFWAAIPVGVDMEPVRWKLAIARHKRQLEHRAEWAEPYGAKVEECLNLTIAYFELLRSGEPDSAADSAAWSAAESAARSAAWSAARSAAWAAARSAAWAAAESAAWAAAESALQSTVSELQASALDLAERMIAVTP